MSSKPTVIVAGAGPVGLSLALFVARAGIPVTVLEKRKDVNRQSKASTFHAPTLDILGQLGVADQMVADGVVVDAIQYRDANGDILARLGFESLVGLTSYPHRLHYEQSDLSDLLRVALDSDERAQLHFDSEVFEIAERGDQVTVNCLHKGRETRFEADFLFGCDGAQSVVRQAAGMETVEKHYPGMVLRLYAPRDLSGHLPGLDGITYIFNGDDSVSLLEMNDCRRVVVRVPEGISEDEAMSDAWAIGRLQSLIPIGDILPAVEQRDVYAATRRHALTPRTNRVFLAGDALHLTNTRGGMNLNAGIHDALALAQGLEAAADAASLEPLHKVADERGRITRDILIPRTDATIGTGRERLRRIVYISKDPDKLPGFLHQQAMLDMLGGVKMPRVNGGRYDG